MSNKVQLALFGIIGFGILVFLDIFVLHATFVNPILPENISKPSTRVYMPSECVVEVSNYLPDGRRSYGKGVVVERNGETFVLTSSMIFTHEGQIMVNRDVDSNTRIGCDATIIHQNDIWGLVALDCYLEGSPSIRINDDPNLPPSAKAWVGDTLIETREYMNNYWVIVDTNLSADMTGAPVEQGTELVGVIVGLNRINTKQAIMVYNRALKEFCDEAMEPPLPLNMEVPPLLPLGKGP